MDIVIGDLRNQKSPHLTTTHFVDSGVSTLIDTSTKSLTWRINRLVHLHYRTMIQEIIAEHQEFLTTCIIALATSSQQNTHKIYAMLVIILVLQMSIFGIDDKLSLVLSVHLT